MSNLKDYIPNISSESGRGDLLNGVSEDGGCKGKNAEISFFRELSPEYFKAILANCPKCNANGKCYIQEDAQKILDIKPANMQTWPDLPD